MKQWVSEKGLDASFLDRHAVLQQVLNTMAAIHNSGNDKSLWGCFMGEWRERERERDAYASLCVNLCSSLVFPFRWNAH